jgi:hypothetical protein
MSQGYGDRDFHCIIGELANSEKRHVRPDTGSASGAAAYNESSGFSHRIQNRS